MKKISLFLFTLCVSVMTWAQINNNTAGLEYTLNPYAYDLKIKSWDPASRILTVQFKLNSPPNLNDGEYNSVTDGEPNGIQIYAVDQQGNEYRIGGPGRADIQNCIKNGYLDFTMDLSAGTTVDGTGPVKNIPVDEILTWKVRVKGRNLKTDNNGASVTKPRRVTVIPNDRRPRHPLGAAVGTNPYAPNFGKILITQPGNGYDHNFWEDDRQNLDGGTWDWLYHELMISYTAFNGTNVTRTPAVLEYSPNLQYKTLHRKYKYDKTDKSYFSSSIFTEPHRVRISEDGRIFVSSYHTSAGASIMEYLGDNTFITIVGYDLTENKDTYAKYNRRVVDFDVKGSGETLKIVAAWVKPRATYKNSKYYAKIQCYEYEIGLDRTNLHQTNDGTLVAECGDYDNGGHGLIYQGYWGAGDTADPYDAGKYGFIGVAYGKGANNPIWMKVDFGMANEFPAHVLYFDNTGSAPTKHKKDVTMKVGSSTAGYYGGNALMVTEDYIITARENGIGKIAFYPISEIKSSGNLPTPTYEVAVPNAAWYNGMAIDYANNLYVTTEFNGNMYTIPLPMPSGMVETPAPKNSTFSLSQPVPNILATDLKCVGHETKPKYIFSFNVNTKPEGAEIRFYTTEADMLADCNKNESYGRYDDHSKCQYYYRFEGAELKQGRMVVELGILGHEGGQELKDKKLPEGKLYWNIFLKTRKSNAFAPMYLQPNTGEHLHYRVASTIDNNPENDGFGHIYAIDTKRVDWTTSAMKDNPCTLMVYTIGDANIDDSNSNGVNSATRYSLVQKLSADDMVQPRRPTVAPDGMVYLTDYGDYRYEGVNFNSTGDGPNEFVLGGIWLFNPNDPYKDAGKTAAKLSRFHWENETVSDACFYHDGTNLKLYKTNTYDEYDHHAGEVDKNYQDAHWTNNGYRVYTMRYNQDGSIIHQMDLADGELVPFKVKDKNGDWVGGDANGSLSVRATSDGVWFCQNRKGDASTAIKPDNIETVALMFYNHDKERKFQSYTYAGGSLTQYTTSLLQSTPGAGMTISPDEKYLYVVNHEGNILEFEIGGSASTGKTLTYRNKYINTTAYRCIVTLDFDYAGNLVATTDQNYPAYLNEGTQIVVFTMPYTHDNARSIPASKSERMIPERLSQDFDNTTTLDKKGTYALDLYRPLQGATYNTICLPFDLDLNTLTTPHKLYGAKAMEFTSVSNPTVGGEKVLCLNFTPVTQLQAGIPYIIYVENHVRGLIEFANVTRDNTKTPTSETKTVEGSDITYTGVYNPTPIGVRNTILVDQNRLANVTKEGTLSGFRGYFTIPESLRSLKAMISTRNDTSTGLEDMNITERTYQKFLREGRVYIRVGETLYTITGEKVE